MKNPKDKEIDAAMDRLRTLLADVARSQGLQNQTALAKYLGMSRGTLCGYLREKNFTTPKRPALETMRSKIPAMTDADVNMITKAYNRKQSLSRTGTKDSPKAKDKQALAQVQESQQTKKSTSQTCATGSDAAIGKMMRELVSALIGKKSDQTVEDVPWVLTEETFSSIDVSSWSQSQIAEYVANTKAVLDEARKRVSTIAQMKQDAVRESFMEEIALGLDMLWRTCSVASAMIPMQYLNDIDMTVRLKSITQKKG